MRKQQDQQRGNEVQTRYGKQDEAEERRQAKIGLPFEEMFQVDGDEGCEADAAPKAACIEDDSGASSRNESRQGA